MTFFTIVRRGLTRRPIRTALTLAGIAIGIAAVVALVGMSGGYEKSINEQLDTIGIDMIVSNMSGSVNPKIFDAGIEDEIAKLPKVKETTTVLMQMISVETMDMVMVSGREWGGFTWNKLKVVDGRLPKDANEPVVVIGVTAADAMQKKVGDTVQLESEELAVVGIVSGGSVVENGAIILPLPVMQRVTQNEGKVNFVDIRFEPDIKKEEVDHIAAEVKRIFPQGRALRAQEVVQSSQGFKVVRAMSWSTSTLAIIVGVFGVMNTMLMTVFERTHEIGILLAVGWKKNRVMKMILAESALLGFLGGVVGVAIGAGAVKLLERSPKIRGLLEPDLSPQLMLLSVAIAVVVGLISGLYPSWRASRMSPSVAISG
ncbi:MAG TPA: FtsX-like permease family protein [Candidatus Saccharimonadia bacterium]|nr:FtsX-like permease family protein [Candidatus Saccharimonadia bacterium]